MSEQPTPVRFGSRLIGRPAPVCVIAEIGINHEGDVGRCREMIAAASEAGADAVKLQTIDHEREYAPDTESHALFGKARLTRAEIEDVFAVARSLKIEVLSTSGDPEMLAFVDSLDPAAHKISSGLADHVTLIRAAAATGRTLLISTGMSSMTDVDRAVSSAREAGAEEIVLLQCTSIYPTAPSLANLGVIRTLQERFEVPVGYSDHTLGTEVAALSVAAGAAVIEKHFTFDTSRPGFDHPISVDVEGLAQLVREIREVEAIVGDGIKQVEGAEADSRRRFRRCVVAATDLSQGTVLSPDDVVVMRVSEKPDGHLPAHAIDAVVGKTLTRSVTRLEPISEHDLRVVTA
jgi:N,N'-diacetyllegionaminate synthase